MRANLKLKARIIELFSSQADFAEAIGVDESLISRIIRGRRELSDSEKRMWARKLKCKRGELFE